MRIWLASMAALLLILPPVQMGTEGEGGGARARDLGVYHTHDELVAELQNLTAAYPNITKLHPLGLTWENRTIWAVKLSDNVSADEAEPNITIFGGIHARELISTEVALHILRSLVQGYGNNSTIRWWVDGAQIWFVPLLNPDGHVYVEQGNDWRKNRRPTGGGSTGVDLNRNFGHLWGLEASRNPPDEDYCGPYPFSENETQAASKLVTDHPPKVTVSYHSFGPYILYPWGNSINQEPVDRRLISIAENMSGAMPEGRRYSPIMARQMYSATGDTDDYFYANLSILPFTVELAGQFRPPDDQVAGICADNLGPVLYLLNYTVGPEPAPPKHSLSLEGPKTFHDLPGRLVRKEFALDNTGEAEEEVSIRATCNLTGWGVNVTSPEQMRLGPGNGTTVILELTVPPSAPAFLTAEVVLNASAASGANASARILGMADQLHKAEIMFTGSGPVGPGADVRVDFTVVNLGNGNENLSLSARTDSGWNITPPPSPLLVERLAASGSFLIVRVPEKALAGTELVLNLTASSGDGGYSVANGTTLTVIRKREVDLLLASHFVSFTQGEPRVVSIQVINKGNWWENGTLVLSGDSRYASFGNASVSIAPFSNTTAELHLDGTKGNWAITVEYPLDPNRSALTTLDFQILANEAPGPTPPSPFPMVIVLVLVIVVVTAAILLLWTRRKKKAPATERKGAP